jgi:hypothetical protein
MIIDDLDLYCQGMVFAQVAEKKRKDRLVVP